MPALGLAVNVLLAVLVFAIIAVTMKWICDSFFGGVKLAYWICGVLLIIMLLVAFGVMFSGTGPGLFKL